MDEKSWKYLPIIISFLFGRFVEVDFKKYCFVFNYSVEDYRKDITTSYKCTGRGFLVAYLLEILAMVILKILHEDDISTLTVWLWWHDPISKSDHHEWRSFGTALFIGEGDPVLSVFDLLFSQVGNLPDCKINFWDNNTKDD